MRITITITSTTTTTIAVTVTTANTLAKTTTADEDPLLTEDSPIQTIVLERKQLRMNIKRYNTFSSSVGEVGVVAPSRVEDCDSDVIASGTPKSCNGVAVLVSWESPTSHIIILMECSSFCLSR